MGYKANEACDRLFEALGSDFEADVPTDLMTVCNHVELYDEDAVMIMLGYGFPKDETFDTAIEEFATPEMYGAERANSIETSLKRMKNRYKRFYP